MVLLLLFDLCRYIDTFICFITHKSVDSDLLLYSFPVDYPGKIGEEYFNQVCGSLLKFKKSSCIFQEVECHKSL